MRLQNSWLDDWSVKVLTEQEWPCSKVLSLAYTWNPAGAAQLFIKGRWPALEKLVQDYANNSDFDASLCNALGAAHMPLMGHLSLRHNFFGTAAMEALARSQWRFLSYLDLSDHRLDAAAIAHLVHGCWQHLEHLFLMNCRLSEMAVCQLAEGDWLILKTLDLRQGH